MPDPRNPRFEDFPETAYLDPASFISAIQQQQESEFTNVDDDNGIFGLAALVLAGIGGYAALKHFPPARIRAVASEIKDILLRPRGHGLNTPQIDKIRGALNSRSAPQLAQLWAHGTPDKFNEVLGKFAANDPEILKTLHRLTEVVGRNPRHFATSASVQRTLSHHLMRPIPQDTSGLRTLTLGDLFSPTGSWQQKLWNMPMPEDLGPLQNVVTKLTDTRIPGLADNIKLFNMRLDPGLLVNRDRGKGVVTSLVNLGNLHPSNMIRGLQKAATSGSTQWFRNPKLMGGLTIAGLYSGYDEDDPVSTLVGGAAGLLFGAIPIRHLARGTRWATELLVPTELLKQTPDLAVISGNLTERFTGSKIQGVTQSIVAHGALFPVFGRQTTHLGGAIAGGIRVGRGDSVMSRAAKISQNEIFIARRLGRAGKTRAAEYIEDIEGGTGRQMNPIKASLIHLGERFGVGPQFKRGRLPGDIDDVPFGDFIPRTIGEIFMDPAKTARKGVLEAARILSGKASQAGIAEHYAYRPLQGLKDHINYQMLRVGRLFEQTTGLGIKAGKTPFEMGKRWLGIGIGAMVGLEALRYLDYHSRRVTGTGPISAPLQAYAAVRNVQQHAFAAVGIQQTSAYLENLMPGLISSPLSQLVRATAVNRLFRGLAPLGGKAGLGFAQRFSVGAGFGRYAMEAGEKVVHATTLGKFVAGAAAFTQLTDITETPAHLAAVYRGEVDVPVREGRWWALGMNPFGGGRVTHTRPHLIPTILSHAREIGTFGSEAGYWGQQFGLPTPESLFGLRPLLFPYEAERANYERRPYPLTGPMVGIAGNLPFIGPTFNATIGELIKPTQRWHGSSRSDGFTGPGTSIGFDPITGQRQVGDPTSMIEGIGKQIDLLRDFLGMPGFMIGAIKSKITGDANFDWSKRQLATAGQMTGMERQLYDMQLGGLLGMTEMMRRFLPHRRRDIEQVNPIRNTMPAWLPGSGTVFPMDEGFYRDFHRGDPMAQMRSGEARLPGPGYEAVHRLHSGIPGVYDAYDRWKILRDIAPTSQAFRHYDAIVKGWARTQSMRSRDPNPLVGLPGSRSMTGVVQAVLDGDTIIVNISGRLINVRIAGADAPELAHSRFEASMPGSVSGELAKRRLENEIMGQPVMINPRDLDVYGRTVADVKTLGIGGRNVSEELRDAFKTYDLTDMELGGIQGVRNYLQTRFEPAPFTNRIFNDPTAAVPRTMRNQTSTSLTNINRAVKEGGQFTLPEKMVGHVWEQISHVNLPGPLNWPVNKLFNQRDPLEIYRQRMLAGGTFANWETPFQSFIRPWANQFIGMVNKDYVPGRIRAQRQAMAQQDALEYRRNKMFTRYAEMAGRGGVANMFQRRAMNTAAGVILSGNRRFARGALARTERGFYDPFAAESDIGRREAILHTVSPQMGTMLKMAWGTNTPEDMAATQGLVESAVPPAGWAGMHPDVTGGMLRARVAHDNAWDFHELGISQSQDYASQEIFSNAFSVPAPPQLYSNSVQAKSIVTMQRLGIRTHTLNTVDSLFGPSISMRLSRDPRQYQHVLRTYGYTPNAQGMRF